VPAVFGPGWPASATLKRRPSLFPDRWPAIRWPAYPGIRDSPGYDRPVDLLARIKRLAIARRVQFTLKAQVERLRDHLSVEDVIESVVNANAIKKVIRSRSTRRTSANERLYVIESPTFGGLWVYTKGTIRRTGGQEVFYVFISSKLSD
jgi:hypothetical protein